MSTGQKPPLERFMAAVDAFEKQGIGVQQKRDGIPRYADSDRQLLARLRDKESHHLLSEALESIENNCRKGAADDKRLRDDKCLVKALSSAKLASENARGLAEIRHRDVEDYRELERCVDNLRNFFANKIYHDPESVITLSPTNGFAGEWFADVNNVEHKQAMLSLEWMQVVIKQRLDALSALELTRKNKSVSAPKVIFMAKVCEAVTEIFGQPLYAAVANLTDVALKTRESTTDEEVRRANRGLKERKAAKAAAALGSDEPIIMFEGVPIPPIRPSELAEILREIEDEQARATSSATGGSTAAALWIW